MRTISLKDQAAARRRVALRRAIRATGKAKDIDLSDMGEQGLLNLASILNIDTSHINTGE